MDRGLTAVAAAQLQDGINLTLSRWTALRMAVENEWGGRNSVHKPQQLVHDLFNLLTQSKEQVYIDDVEDMLKECMLSLNAQLVDCSNEFEEVAYKMMVMHEECSEGNFDSIKRLKETNIPSLSYFRQPGNNDSEDEEEDDDTMRENNTTEMEIDAPQATEVPGDEDGWTPVPSRRNKGRQKRQSY